MCRVVLGLSQSQLAARVGISRREVAHWEKNQQKPSVNNLLLLSDVLQVSTDWLIAGKGWIKELERSEKEGGNTGNHRSSISRIPMFDRFPLKSSPKHARWLNVLPEDTGAIAYTVTNLALIPNFLPGDQLFIQTINLRFRVCEPATTELRHRLLMLDKKVVAVSLNHEHYWRTFHVFIEKAGKPNISMAEIGAQNTSSPESVRDADSLLIHGVVYKYIRQL